jgi:hypothetical protein
MSIEETKEAIRVMQSFVDGNEVEYQISDGTWCDALTPSWNWASARYRIKPTPLRCARELEHELKAANSKIEALNRGNANAERILCELTGCESGRDVPDWIVKKDWELTDLAKAYLELVHKHTLANERIKRLEEAWIPASTKPEGYERRVLLWVVWQGFGWIDQPEAKIGWWRHGPGCFAFDEFENADHLVTHWMEIADPTQAKEAKL